MPYENEQTISVYAGRIGSWKNPGSRLPVKLCELADRYDAMAATWSCMPDHLGYSQASEYLMGEAIDEVELTRNPGAASNRVGHVKS